MKRKNKIIVTISLILLFVCFASPFIFMSLDFGIGVIEGRQIDKERQRNYFKYLYMKGKVSNVTKDAVEIQLDSISSFKTIFPREYIPPYQIVTNDGICYLTIDNRVLKGYTILKGQIFIKELNKDYIIIDSKKFELFNW